MAHDKRSVLCKKWVMGFVEASRIVYSRNFWVGFEGLAVLWFFFPSENVILMKKAIVKALTRNEICIS